MTRPWKVGRIVGAVVAYGSLACFLTVIATQLHHWLRDGEWVRIGLTDGLRIGLMKCCVQAGDSGHLAKLVHWLDSPVDWLGLHTVLEVIPASVALFLLSVVGNWLLIYGSDRLAEQQRNPQ